MNLDMRFPLSKSCLTPLKLHRHIFYIIYHKNNYQAYQKVHFKIFQHTLLNNFQYYLQLKFKYLTNYQKKIFF